MSLLLAGGIGTGLLVVPLLLTDLSDAADYRIVQAGSASNHLGLADPLIVRRFLYWGVCTSAVFCIWMTLAVRALMAGSVWLFPVFDIVSALLGFVVAGSLWLAFFPSKAAVAESTSSRAEGTHS